MNRKTKCPECGTVHMINDFAPDGPERPCPTCDNPTVNPDGEKGFDCSLFGPGKCSSVPICEGIECPPSQMLG